MVSPWTWAGWVVAALLAMLYYRLWTSASVKELDGLRRELVKARKTIATLRELEVNLTNRNEELHTQVKSLEADNKDLHAAVDRLTEANKLQHEVIARMELNQNELIRRLNKCEAIIDSLKTRVIQLDAQNGNVSDLNDSIV